MTSGLTGPIVLEVPEAGSFVAGTRKRFLDVDVSAGPDPDPAKPAKTVGLTSTSGDLFEPGHATSVIAINSAWGSYITESDGVSKWIKVCG